MTIQSDPEYPVVGDVVTLSITAATGSTDATRFEITSVPENSTLETGMLVDEGGDPVQEFTPDVAGAYGVTAYDYRRFIGIPRYAGDPTGASYERLVATQSGTVYVGESLDLPIRGAGHQITLRLTVANGTVRAASLVSPTTAVARYAALDATVLAAVAALEDVAVASLGEDLPTDVEALRSAFGSHTQQSEGPPAVHEEEDDVNPIDVEQSGSVVGSLDLLNRLYDRIVAHMSNSGGGFHTTPDRLNMPIASKASDMATATVLLADLRRRVYSRHIDTVGSPAVHGTADDDVDSVLSADLPLTAAIVAILDYFADNTPTAPAGTNPGAVSLAGMFGFARAAA
jgi:hypothetical protein